MPTLIKPYKKLPPHGLQPDRRLPSVKPGQAVIQEVFSSIQGEGPWVGCRQLFVRVSHCHLACQYCDTPMTTASGEAYLESSPGTNYWEPHPNPMTPDALLDWCQPLLETTPHHSLSLTGGEPLLYPEFAKELFRRAWQRGLKTYLETSGTQPRKLEAVLPFTSMVAMDIKLRSATGQTTPWQLHQQFYERANSSKHLDVCLKLIVSEQTSEAELEQLSHFIPDPEAAIFLQPVTPLTGEQKPALSPQQLLNLQSTLSRYYKQVRVIPQTHKWLTVT